MEKTILGRKESISLPEWDIGKINAKIDTGAYNCTIHVSLANEIQEGGKKLLEFIPLEPSHKSFSGKKIQTAKYKVKKVKNSFGQMEKRYLVLTSLAIGDATFPAAFTLSNRSNMKNAVLLGRKILKGRFLVDVDKVNLAGNPKYKNQ
ncbi:RimK/LysX family protein [Cyclobacterium sp.]|uniref:ATP-dependent zinc protease family protein n=1 Tax=Cyclobacterium sp. TaxID=1966343 RepID=UPI00198B3D6D|nr:RimK/LysX family protein [Cyclobacterium sp.]MBD3630218.1 ATP-dependent zinc protease [Cyclobacterium sp.]